MIEVRSCFVCRARYIEVKGGVLDLCKDLRKIFPKAGWECQVQQMLIGHVQQSLIALASRWESLAAWEAGVIRLRNYPEYQEWMKKISSFLAYGEATEIFTLLEGPEEPSPVAPGMIEVRSGYIVEPQNMDRVKELVKQRPSRLKNDAFWYNDVTQSSIVISSMWQSLASWEEAMKTAEDQEFEDWYREWMETVEFGGGKEVLRNL
ncbi:MAG: hypothetical protein JRI84_13205 [Deltaproteobacteria bacterium]|nr:hypothetical protein [Deltaproteobacteria bacterium]